MKVYFIFFLFQLLLIWNQDKLLCAKPLIGENVVDAGDNEFPSAVAVLVYRGDHLMMENDVICTGSLISREHFVTAEHCLYMYNNSYVTFIVGSNDVREGLKRFTMWWLSYNQWMNTFGRQIIYHMNDIAVVKFTRSVPNFINPVAISNALVGDVVGWEIVMAGWGLDGNQRRVRFLKKATAHIVHKRECEQIAARIQGHRISSPYQWFCSHEDPYAQLELGDSGGGAFYQNNTLVGINIGNFPNYQGQFHPEKMNVHLCVGHYTDFTTFAMGE